MYSLTYDMIVQVLQQFNYSGEVHADIFPCANMRKGGRVILAVRSGSVVSCVIFSENGQKFYHDTEAYNFIVRLGVLDWKLVFAASPPSTAFLRSSSIDTPPSMETPVHSTRDGHFPRRRVVSPTQMRAWSMLYRSVYSLCDGTHSNELIATLLSRPPHSVEKVIRDLIDANAIEA
jgi:hypothetical protein